MKKLLTLLLLAITSMAFAQTPHTDAYLKNYTDSLIRKITLVSKNVANTYQLGWDSKVSVLSPKLGTSSTVGYVWTATNTSGAGSWQAPPAGTVTAVNGTTNRITSTGGATPTIDISSTFEALLGKVANPLSQFASTTSSQFAGVISDETGTGSVVFSASPALTGTPTAPTASGGTNTTQIATTAHVFVNYQPKDTDLTTIAQLTPSNNDFMQFKSGGWANRTVAQVKTDLGIPTTFSDYLRGGVTNTLSGNTYFIAGDSSVTSFTKIAIAPGAVSIKASSFDANFASKIDIDTTGIHLKGFNVPFYFHAWDSTIYGAFVFDNLTTQQTFTFPDESGIVQVGGVDFSSIENLPTDLSGYGITDALKNGATTLLTNDTEIDLNGNVLSIGAGGGGSDTFTLSETGYALQGNSPEVTITNLGGDVIIQADEDLKLSGGQSLQLNVGIDGAILGVQSEDAGHTAVFTVTPSINADVSTTFEVKGDGLFGFRNANGTISLPTDLPAADGYSLVGNMDGTTEWANISGGGGSVPTPTTGDAGKQLRVTVAEDGYELFTPNLDPTTTNEDMIIRRSGALDRLAAGSNGNYLQMVAGAVTWAAPTLPISSLTGAGGSNTIDNANNKQTWTWNTWTAATEAFAISSSSTSVSGNSPLVRLSLTGAQNSITSTPLIVENSRTGSSTLNTAGYFSASGGTINHALWLNNGTIRIGAGANAGAGDIVDVNNNELLKWTAVASAVNELTITNAVTTANARISATGGDTNIGIDHLLKGTGVYAILGNSTQAARFTLAEDTDNGTNFGTLKFAESLSGNPVVTFGSDDFTFTTAGSTSITFPTSGTMATLSGTETFANKTLGTALSITVAPTLTAGVRWTFAPNATNSGFNAGSVSGDPSSPSNGDVWYNSLAGTLKFRSGGNTLQFGTGSGNVAGNLVTGSRVVFTNGTNSVIDDADMTYNSTSNVLTVVGGLNASNGHVILGTAGNRISIKTGTNASAGTATLVAGTATVNTTAVSANSIIILTSQADGGTTGAVRVTTKTAGTSFVITSLSVADTSTIGWLIIEGN